MGLPATLLEKKEAWLLLALFVLSFLLRAYPLELTHWWDECVYLQHGEIIAGLKLDNYNEFAFRPPLLPLILAPAFLLWNNVIFADLIVAAIGAAAPVFLYLVGKRLYSPRAAALAALFLTINPFAIYNSHIILTDMPALTLGLAAFYLFLTGSENRQADKQGEIYFAFSGILFGLAVLMKFTSVLFLAAPPLYLVLCQPLSSRKKPLGAILSDSLPDFLALGFGFFLMLLPYLVWAQLAQGLFLSPFIHAIMVTNDYNEPFYFYLTELYQIIREFSLVGLLLALYFFFARQKEGAEQKATSFLIALALVFLLALSLSPHKELRYALPVLFPLTLLAAEGYLLLWAGLRPAPRLLLALFVLLLVLLSFFFSGLPGTLGKPLFNQEVTREYAAAQYLNALNLPAGETVYSNFNYPVLAYYTDYPIAILWPWDTSFYDRYPDNMPTPGILVTYYKDFKHPSYEWLQQHPEFELIHEENELYFWRYTPANHT